MKGMTNMPKNLSEQQIEDIFMRRGGFTLCAKYPSDKNPSYDYISVGIDGVPNNLSYTVRVFSDGRFSLSFHPSYMFAELKMSTMSGFEDDERFARITEQFSMGVRRLEGCCS